MGIFIVTVYIATDHCPQDVDAEYGIMWPPTIINMDASNNCPDGAGMDRYSDLRIWIIWLIL